MYDADPRMAGEPLPQPRDQMAIDLIADQLTAARSQRLGERPLARADLHQEVAGAWAGGAYDAGDGARVGEEVLPVRAPRAVAFGTARFGTAGFGTGRFSTARFALARGMGMVSIAGHGHGPFGAGRAAAARNGPCRPSRNE
ncbi:hypothetical protein SMF913_27647 [Streptomyces malaysiensis]|uniref:Uncharacterized protein n=1 Tax=Streptomyces malaysiensis TaxID=92644 RepID=A0A2J7YVX7_STRMQ|nr:hypothetical protein SMF913_27647 [Streptomyces malaysiensis]